VLKHATNHTQTVGNNMKKTTVILFMVFGLNSILAQIEGNIYELNSIENLLTEDVATIA
jgi:erythromycin esterase